MAPKKLTNVIQWVNCLSKVITLAIVLTFAIGLALPVGAQQADLRAMHQRFVRLYTAGDYPAALAEAQKLEAVIKARLGTSHKDYFTILNNIALVYAAEGKYDDAEAYHKRVLAMREKVLGANHPDVAQTLNNLTEVYWKQGKYDKAEGVIKRLLTTSEKVRGHPHLADYLNNLGLVYEAQGKYAEAEGLHQRALVIREKALGTHHLDVAASLNNIGNVYKAQGKYAEALIVYQRALTITENAKGTSDLGMAPVLNNLAGVYWALANYVDAAALYQRALAIREKALGPSHADVAQSLNNLAVVYEAQGKHVEASELLQRALIIREKTLGAGHPDVAATLQNLALVYGAQGKYADAERLQQRAQAIWEKAPGASHADLATSVNNLANLYRKQDKYAEAVRLYQRALAISEKGLGANHPDVAKYLNNLANSYRESGNPKDALAYSRMATSAVIAHAATEGAVRQENGSSGLVEKRADYFRSHVASLAAASHSGIEPAAALGHEAFEIAQWAVHSSAAEALQQMAVRFAAGGGALATLVRESQDLATRWSEHDKMLVLELSKPEDQQSRASIESLRKSLAEVETKLVAVRTKVEKEFPNYAALASPKPLKLEELQTLLGADEALVFFLTAENATYVFAMAQDAFSWMTLAVTDKTLLSKVAAYRKSIAGPLSDFRGFARADIVGSQDYLAQAYEFYELLFGPIEDVIRNKKHLIIVPTGPLTSLPFQTLVIERPKDASNPNKPTDAAWLITRHAVSVLPSVASLQALRTIAKTSSAAEPFIGFGNPLFQNRPTNESRQAGVSPLRGVSEYFRGALGNTSMLRNLAPLPETADEIKGIAKSLGASEQGIVLGFHATEAAVKDLSGNGFLAAYRVVAFATHGLIAGEIKGLAEPALALTVPNQPTEADDGLLTSSEVAQLKFNADWVILSACNTAAGDQPGAEALSGLARAFFYAGARGLLVSHWPVDSQAAVKLTTRAIAELKADPQIGRAEALRRSMVAVMQDKSDPRNIHPAVWAPFMLVGEGGAGRDR